MINTFTERIKRYRMDDRAVSPVIGVILMVAITVILAAVMGAFVLGLGGNQKTAPQTTIDAGQTQDNVSIGDWETTDMHSFKTQVVTFEHTGGESIQQRDIKVRSEYTMAGTTYTGFGLSWEQKDIGDGQAHELVHRAGFNNVSKETLTVGDRHTVGVHLPGPPWIGNSAEKKGIRDVLEGQGQGTNCEIGFNGGIGFLDGEGRATPAKSEYDCGNIFDGSNSGGNGYGEIAEVTRPEPPSCCYNGDLVEPDDTIYVVWEPVGVDRTTKLVSFTVE